MFEFFKGTVTGKDWAFVGVVLGVTVLLGVAFYMLMFTRQEAQLEGLNAENADLRTRLRSAQITKENIDDLRREAEMMEDLVLQFEKRLPERREIPQLLNSFERKADELGLRVELTTQPTQRDPNKETIPYKVTATGGFHEILTFINLFERDERYLKISDIDVGEQRVGAVTATFTLSTFRFIDSPGN